jgi:hypothetical protein
MAPADNDEDDPRYECSSSTDARATRKPIACPKDAPLSSIPVV